MNKQGTVLVEVELTSVEQDKFAVSLRWPKWYSSVGEGLTWKEAKAIAIETAAEWGKAPIVAGPNALQYIRDKAVLSRKVVERLDTTDAQKERAKDFLVAVDAFTIENLFGIVRRGKMLPSLKGDR